MRISELQFDFPESLIATKPEANSRIMWHDEAGPREITKAQLLEAFQPGDVLVVNDTKVIPRRILINDDFDILFLRAINELEWEALFQLRKLKGTTLQLPGGVTAELLQKGRPHHIRTSEPLTDSYFEKHGEPPLPPYIYRARGELRARDEDFDWYQTEWARAAGSVAAPTASFHFKSSDFERLREAGVYVETVTLHVGAGTFLPVTVDNLNDHVMHKEYVAVPQKTWDRVSCAKKAGRKIWVLGTTATRAIESAAHGLLGEFAAPEVSVLGESSSDFEDRDAPPNKFFVGETALLIKPGFEFKIVDRLLTNFHQPESTLLALVCAFAGREQVMSAYRWAIERNYRLFSYGDLSVWKK